MKETRPGTDRSPGHEGDLRSHAAVPTQQCKCRRGIAPSEPCLDGNTSALFMLTATFPPTECLTAPPVAYSVCGPNGTISGGTFRVVSACLSGMRVGGRRHRRPILERAARSTSSFEGFRSRPDGHSARICGRHARESSECPTWNRSVIDTGKGRFRYTGLSPADRCRVAQASTPAAGLSGQRRERAGPPAEVGELQSANSIRRSRLRRTAVKTESFLAPTRHLFGFYRSSTVSHSS
jgi:hypothetical protein